MKNIQTYNYYACSLIILFIILSCSACLEKSNADVNTGLPELSLEMVVLGTIQDAGSPHIDCRKSCCKNLLDAPEAWRQVVSLGLIDPLNHETYLFEATPDMSKQLAKLSRLSGFKNSDIPDGIFVSHAHIGHYTGLMYLGKEARNTDSVKVYSLPEMKRFLESNGPWSQLAGDGNIELIELTEDSILEFNNFKVKVIRVPHRDEFSETAGFIIEGPSKKLLFIPDIDKWKIWNRDIIKEIKSVDYAFLDGTFYNAEEIGHRDMSQIPHPFIIESMDLFDSLPPEEKSKIHFIHFNHTNPVLDTSSNAYTQVIKRGFNISFYGQRVQI